MYNEEAMMMRALKIFHDIYPQIKEIETVNCLGALIGTMIDQWCADKNVSDMEAHEMLVNLAVAHLEINNIFGAMEASE